MHARRRLVALCLVLLLAMLGSRDVWGQTVERYLVADRPTATLRSFNVSDNAPVNVVRTGVSPETIAVSPNGRLAFVANLNGNFVSVLDLTLDAEVARLHNLRVRHMALNSAGTRLVAPLTGQPTDDVVIIDTSTFAELARVSLDGLIGDAPGQLNDIAHGPVVVVGNRAYLNPRGSFTMSGVAALPIAVVDLDTFTVSTIAGSNTGFAPFNSSIDATPDGNHVVALRVNPRQLQSVETATGVLTTIAPDQQPFAIAVTRTAGDPDGIYGYVVQRNLTTNDAMLTAVDLNLGSPTFGQFVPGAVATLPFLISGGPFDPEHMVEIALTADSSLAYVVTANQSTASNVFIVDTAKLLNDPANAVVNQFRIDTALRALAVASTYSAPPAGAPVVTGVTPSLAVNNVATTVHVTGSGFDPDARVRIGSLDPALATFLSSTDLEVVLPASAPSQGADIVVTNPRSAGAMSDQHQSGILRGQLTVASPPIFQPVHQAVVVDFGDSTLAVLNSSTDATVTPTTLVSPEPLRLAIAPDGERAYVALFRPPAVRVHNLLSSTNEAYLQLSTDPLVTTGGIAVAPHPVSGKPVAYSAARSAGDETLSVIDADPASPSLNTVIDTLFAGLTDVGASFAGAFARTPNGRFVYVGNEADAPSLESRLIVFDVLTRAVATHDVGLFGIDVLQSEFHITPDGESLLMRTPGGAVKVFDIGADPMNPVPVATITGVPPAPLASVSLGAFQVVGNRLFAFDSTHNVALVFNFDRMTPDFSQLGAVIVPGTPGLFLPGVAVTPDGTLMYALQFEDDAVAVLDTAKLSISDPSALLTRIQTGLGPMTIAIRPGTPTATGSGVPVQPIQEVNITFSNVTTTGATTATTTYTNPNPTPAGFQVGDPPIFYEIATTATFTGPIEVCFTYDETQFTGPESDLRVLHEEDGMFVDRTILPVDTLNNIICAQVDSFSSFVVGVGSADFLFDTLQFAVNEVVEQQGIQRSLRSKVLNARAARDRGNGAAATSQLNAFKAEVSALVPAQLTEAEAEQLLLQADALLGQI